MTKWRKNMIHNLDKLSGTCIIRKYRRTPSSNSLATGQDVKVKEFAEFIRDYESNRRVQNAHWETYFRLCHPCLVNYTFIGKLESVLIDYTLMKHVLCWTPHQNLSPERIGSNSHFECSTCYVTLHTTKWTVIDVWLQKIHLLCRVIHLMPRSKVPTYS